MHISERDLDAILFDGATESSFEQIESHVEKCLDCRTRLESRAADNGWREKINGVLSDRMVQQVVVEMENLTLDRLPAAATNHNDLDSKFVLNEIQDVIQPPKHPGNAGAHWSI